MFKSLVFSLNATIPIFMIMVAGYVLKRIGFLKDVATDNINMLVFKVFLPALLFVDLAQQNFVQMWDSSFVIFCALTTALSIIISLLISFICCESSDRGEFIQASYRSAAATLGIAFMANIYNNVAMVALMIIGSVPIYNVVAVFLLSVTAKKSNETKDTKELFKATFKSIITNPIIIGIVAGILWSVFDIPKVPIIVRSMTYLGNCASPLALIGLGASFEFGDLKDKIGSLLMVNVNKLFLWCIIFLPIAIWMGYRDEKLVAALIMLGSATTSSSFVMAKNMGHKGIISSSSVMTTTLFSALSLTLWLFVLRSLEYI